MDEERRRRRRRRPREKPPEEAPATAEERYLGTPGKGKPREKRRFDQTYLNTETHHSVHRDYGAHFFRWGFALRFAAGKKILEVGCGPDAPLSNVLIAHGRINDRPEFYLGVDLNKIKRTWNSKLREAWGEFNFIERWPEVVERYGRFNLGVNLEVIEHMGVEDGDRLLEGYFGCLEPGATFLLSTPRNEGHKPARNHIYEYATEELREKVERAGFEVVRRFGTFGDVPQLRKHARKEHRQVMDELAEYYENDVLSLFLAPLYPDHCKNNLWVLRRP